MDQKPVVTITEFTDPACTWCWGSESVLRKLESHFPGEVKVNYVMGGLAEDIRQRGVPDTPEALADYNKGIALHWLDASSHHGMPVETKGYNLLTQRHYGTYPLNIAYEAAKYQGRDKADKFLRKMREATASFARQTNRDEVLIELATEAGLDLGDFLKHYSDGSAEKDFAADRQIVAKYGVNGFPAFLLKSDTGKELLLNGYQSYDNMLAAIQYLTGDALKEVKILPTEASVLAFIRKYGRVAAVELKDNFDLSQEALKILVDKLKKTGKIDIIPAGNSYYLEEKKAAGTCDPTTGICSI